MITYKVNLNSVSKSYIDGLLIDVRLFVFMLMSFTLLLPAIVQADGLFDFQMKLAEKGNAEAEYKVGEMYETGFGVEKNMDKALSWITKSAAQGHETAKFKLLYWDVEKNSITKSNKPEVEALISKARAGNPQAQFYVGKMHAHGIGVKKNTNKAIEWLNKAALVGVLAAESELIVVRERKQRQALAQQKAKRRADAKRQKELEVKQERERQAQIEKQRKIQGRKQADDIARQNKARASAERKAEQQAAILEQEQAQVREGQKQALLKKRETDKKKRKMQFESDPCSGKSARFLSTCR